jgi:hypothetical protein
LSGAGSSDIDNELQLQPAALLLLMAGCAAVDIPRPTPGDVERAASTWPRTSMADLELGRSLYLARCTGCHQPAEPRRFSASVWKEQVLEMQERARLTADDVASIIRYLTIMAEKPPAKQAPEPALSAQTGSR